MTGRDRPMRRIRLSSRQRITVHLIVALLAFWALAGFITVRVVNAQLSERIDNDLMGKPKSATRVAGPLGSLGPKTSMRVDPRVLS